MRYLLAALAALLWVGSAQAQYGPPRITERITPSPGCYGNGGGGGWYQAPSAYNGNGGGQVYAGAYAGGSGNGNGNGKPYANGYANGNGNGGGYRAGIPWWQRQRRGSPVRGRSAAGVRAGPAR